MVIPNISSDEALASVIDELKHRIKTSPLSEMREDFNATLNVFIRRWRLDGDQHCYAVLPDDHVERIWERSTKDQLYRAHSRG